MTLIRKKNDVISAGLEILMLEETGCLRDKTDLNIDDVLRHLNRSHPLVRLPLLLFSLFVGLFGTIVGKAFWRIAKKTALGSAAGRSVRLLALLRLRSVWS